MLAMKAFRGAGWLVLSRFLGRLLDFVTLLILARVLTPEDFGVTALAMSLVMIVDVVLEVPVTQALVRLPSIQKSHLDTGFALGALRGIAVALIVLIAAWPFSAIYGDATLAVIAIALAVGPIARGLVSPAMVHFVRDLRFRPIFLAEISGKVFAFAAALVTFAYGGGYWAIVVNSVGAGVGTMVATYVIAPYLPRPSLSRIGDFASFVGWFGLSQVVSAVNWQSDRLLLGGVAARATVGRYAVAGDIAVMPTQSLIGPAMQSLMAAFAQINGDKARLRSGFLRAARAAMLVAAPTAVGMALTADLIVAILLGPAWSAAAPFLAWLALSVAIVPYFQVLCAFALAVDRPRTVFQLNLAELGLRAALLPIGLYAFHANGLAAARLAVAVAMFGIYLAAMRRLAGLGVLEQLANLWKVGAATAAMAVCVAALRTTLSAWDLFPWAEAALAAGTGAGAYALALLALGMRLRIGAGKVEISEAWL